MRYDLKSLINKSNIYRKKLKIENKNIFKKPEQYYIKQYENVDIDNLVFDDLPSYYEEKVSIIITTYNQTDLCKEAIESLLKNTKDIKYTLHLVDNGSKEKIYKYFEKVPNSVVYRNEENLGFIMSNNIVLNTINSGHVLLLNDDVILPNKWLNKLLYVLYSNKDIGVVGPSTVVYGYEQGKRFKQLYDQTLVDKIAYKTYITNRNNFLEVKELIGFCFLIRDVVFKKVGLLDDRFGIGTYEDLDYCKRVKKQGYKIIEDRSSFVFHYRGKTFNNVSGWNGYMEQLYKNKALYEEKWPEEKKD